MRISGNIVSDCAFSAIRANSASNLQITGNTCSESGETAIYAEFAFEGAVVSSNIVDGAANGISIVNFNEGGRMAVCSGNLVRNMKTEGPYPADAPGFGVGITVEADTAVTGNVIENAPRYGMHIGWGEFMRNVTATGNVIRRSPTGIAVSVVDGVGPAVIVDNVVEGATKGARRGLSLERTGDGRSGDDRRGQRPSPPDGRAQPRQLSRRAPPSASARRRPRRAGYGSPGWPGGSGSRRAPRPSSAAAPEQQQP